MRKPADKDLLDALATLELEAEYAYDASSTDEDFKNVKSAIKDVVTFRRLVREAGYDLPKDFDWQRHIEETQHENP